MTAKHLPSGDVQLVLMGPWGRIDLAHVTEFKASADEAAFRAQHTSDAYGAVRRIVGMPGTFYVYSAAPDRSTRTHQIDGATITDAHVTGLVQFTFGRTRRI